MVMEDVGCSAPGPPASCGVADPGAAPELAGQGLGLLIVEGRADRMVAKFSSQSDLSCTHNVSSCVGFGFGSLSI